MGFCETHDYYCLFWECVLSVFPVVALRELLLKFYGGRSGSKRLISRSLYLYNCFVFCEALCPGRVPQRTLWSLSKVMCYLCSGVDLQELLVVVLVDKMWHTLGGA